LDEVGTMMQKPQQILVTGATGYIGGRLIPRLLESNYQVRVLARDPKRLAGRAWTDQVEIVKGDVLEPESLIQACSGIDVAYYFIHSMVSTENFHQRDIDAAHNFGEAAHQAGVKRIIYLGGLGDPESELSAHLRSRQETGQALTASGVPVTEFRAAVIVGSGSISFEMIRYLTERVPIMVCPSWVYNRIQPIAIRNVLDYLVATLEEPESIGEVIEIGGSDIQTYASMMKTYASERGLRRILLPVPVLTPFLSSYWVHWVTPINARLARPLIEGLRNEVIVRNDKATKMFPSIVPVDYRTAVSLALSKLDAGQIETSWADALVSSHGDQSVVVLRTQEGMIEEHREYVVNAPADIVYNVFTSLGGENGWAVFNWAWQLRGLLDRLVGGAGLRRGRRDPKEIRVGDALDFWRVEVIDVNKQMLLRAEMKVPGRAWLEFKTHPLNDNQTTLTQTAYFAPKGLAGLLYWYLLHPFQGLIFSRMIRAIGLKAETLYKTSTT
jgi:uncharacterized protein YbjT (DUF2867 family)